VGIIRQVPTAGWRYLDDGEFRIVDPTDPAPHISEI
jgi:hypothetical protein